MKHHWALTAPTSSLFVYTFLNQIILQKIWESFILASIYSFIFLFFFKQKSKFIWEFQALIPHKLKISFSLHDQSSDISTPVADVAYGFSVLKFFHFVYYQSCHKITNHMNLMADAQKLKCYLWLPLATFSENLKVRLGVIGCCWVLLDTGWQDCWQGVEYCQHCWELSNIIELNKIDIEIEFNNKKPQILIKQKRKYLKSEILI